MYYDYTEGYTEGYNERYSEGILRDIVRVMVKCCTTVFTELYNVFQTSTENMRKLPEIILLISWKGVKFVDAHTKVC